MSRCQVPHLLAFLLRVGSSEFVFKLPALFLYFWTISCQPVPVLLCIWLFGAERQKPDKEVRDRRLNQSQPAPAG